MMAKAVLVGNALQGGTSSLPETWRKVQLEGFGGKKVFSEPSGKKPHVTSSLRAAKRLGTQEGCWSFFI